MLKRVFFLLVLSLSFFVALQVVRADELADIERQLNEVRSLLEASKKTSEPLEANLKTIESKINSAEAQINTLAGEVEKKKTEITLGEKDLIKQRQIINERARNYYKQSRGYLGNILGLFLSKNIPLATRSYLYQQQSLHNDKDTIIKTAFFIRTLEDKKDQLVDEQQQLAVFKKELDQEKAFFQTELAKVKDYEFGLERQIADLSAKQQQLVSQRLASLNIPRSAGTSARGCSDDRSIDPGFSPRIALFSYGAPHRNGLNQYGAWGRAKEGQNEEQILQAYYPNFSLRKDYDQNTSIVTTTGWSGTIEEYVQRIYEVPDSWTDNNLAVLKAQAVAARTYALNSMQRNGSICTTESCQVFKPEAKGGNWEQAANATAGWVLIDGDSPGFTQYASTHGGYILNLGKFDGREGNPTNFSELNDRAYDKESPWFYCDWGARSEFANTAWLKPSEVADIVNVILLARRDSSAGEHLYQTDKPHPYGGELWNEDRIRQELRNFGITPYSNVSDLTVGADFNSGVTTSVNISGDAGRLSVGGEEFKNWFNLRAPANLQIVGPLYNSEKR